MRQTKFPLAGAFLFVHTGSFQPGSNGNRIAVAAGTASSMAHIIDGNNVMGQTPGWHRDKPNSRRALLKKAAMFAKARGARVTIVFDGAPDHGVPDGSAFRGVKVLYAEPGSDADARILRLVENSNDPRGLTVVTSDRHLSFLVRSRGATVVRSGEFRKQLESIFEAQPSLEDGEQFDVGDVNAWLRYFGSLPEDDVTGDER